MEDTFQWLLKAIKRHAKRYGKNKPLTTGDLIDIVEDAIKLYEDAELREWIGSSDNF